MERRLLDKIVVVDVEATCWRGQPPHGEESEIIEIGACFLDVASGERTDRASLLVRPERSTVGDFCAELTTLTQDQVDGGMAFSEACAALRTRFQSNKRLWASYGDYDRRMFDRQCDQRGVPYPFGNGHVNVKSLLAVTCGLSREVGLARAMERLGLPLEGTHHRGSDEAWNVAAVLWRIIHSARPALRRAGSG